MHEDKFVAGQMWLNLKSPGTPDNTRFGKSSNGFPLDVNKFFKFKLCFGKKPDAVLSIRKMTALQEQTNWGVASGILKYGNCKVKPPKIPPFHDVTQGEGEIAEPTFPESKRGLDVEKNTRHMDKLVNTPKYALEPKVIAEGIHATRFLHSVHIDQRRDRLRPMLALEEACLNEEMRERFNNLRRWKLLANLGTDIQIFDDDDDEIEKSFSSLHNDCLNWCSAF
ncbi:hypothetical protein CLF_104994 [Clonorchis sinensis]|uniref:Uncharacterized protein n=1 Tax=Clonorchis sinensis TaxID=79923 RepID=G7YCS2_CLOSI|nr:hypothetical protein CLF_104994 [Clonorchis sinensis]